MKRAVFINRILLFFGFSSYAILMDSCATEEVDEINEEVEVLSGEEI